MSEYKEAWRNLLHNRQICILATVSEDQPEADTMCYTFLETQKQMIFTTHRNTTKFENMCINENVSINISDNQGCVTMTGKAKIIEEEETMKSYRDMHLENHPQFKAFISEDEEENTISDLPAVIIVTIGNARFCNYQNNQVHNILEK